MGSINVEKLSEILAERVYWDEAKFSYDEFIAVLKKAIEESALFYLDEDGEIDDWEMFGYDAECKANKLLGNND